MSTIGFSEHDHDRCIDTALSEAESHCARNKLQFTAVRRRVLEILLNKHQAMGAYDILAILADEGLGSQPPVAYRALDFLVQNGFVHRIERLNAYTACAHPNHDHVPAFLICRECKAVAEADTEVSQGSLSDAAKTTGFTIEKIVVEAEGICPACAGAA
ncbi:Zinc uptake regulation protein [Falsiruegeria litorea R37]|uniref:Zinc uptake regulation protein n=1 Tax=Falsiruegeria litorea R37 TaxID=1200284 RepID=A0A1Y5S0D5_9RHOB|nr:transcriptional repressor [Falsiruegeria litorea]SLN29474.1 Zinc uptake regulation protein [Falsiruegeria litorea R37]